MSTFHLMSIIMSILHVSDLTTFHTHDAAIASQRVLRVPLCLMYCGHHTVRR